MSGSITSANASIVITCAKLGIVHKVSGFQVDKAFSTENKVFVETVMGIDGKLSAGAVKNKTVFVISLMPDSQSFDTFAEILKAGETLGDVLPVSIVISLPSVSKNYTMGKGFITAGKLIPDATKMLQGVDYTIEGEALDPTPF